MAEMTCEFQVVAVLFAKNAVIQCLSGVRRKHEWSRGRSGNFETEHDTNRGQEAASSF